MQICIKAFKIQRILIYNVKNNNWPSFNGKIWHRNYYDHIIKNIQELEVIIRYIKNNPKNFKEDKLVDPINYIKFDSFF